MLTFDGKYILQYKYYVVLGTHEQWVKKDKIVQNDCKFAAHKMHWDLYHEYRHRSPLNENQVLLIT